MIEEALKVERRSFTIVPFRESFLMVLDEKNRYGLPGGHIEDESPEESAIREVEEETGLIVVITGKVIAYKSSNVWHRRSQNEPKRKEDYVFVGEYVGGERRLGKGIQRIEYFPWEDIEYFHRKGQLRPGHLKYIGAYLVQKPKIKLL